MSGLDVLRRGVDGFRTAPLGFSLMGASLVWPTEGLIEGGPELIDLAVISPGAAGVAISSLLVARQYKLRHRLEEDLERYGYDDRAFATTTDEWCARQTARVVLGDTDALSQYEALCERRSDTAQLEWLPHI